MLPQGFIILVTATSLGCERIASSALLNRFERIVRSALNRQLRVSQPL